MKSIGKFLKEEKAIILALLVLIPIICITLLNIRNTKGDKSVYLGNTILGNNLNTMNTTNTMNSIIDNSNKIAIRNEADLRNLAKEVDKGSSKKGYEYILTNDIEVSSEEWNPIGESSEKCFQGIFNGNGFTIKGVTITLENDYVGLFSSNHGIIKNLKTSGFNINVTSENVGNIAGTNWGIIQNCQNDSNITGGGHVGGIVGGNYEKVIKCTNTGNVTGNYNIGGIAGELFQYGHGLSNGAHILNSENRGSIKGNGNCGGIAGYSGNSSRKKNKVENCINSGKVTSTGTSGGIIGIIGDFTDAKYCTNLADVIGSSEVGGIVGKISNDSSLEHCLVENCKIYKNNADGSGSAGLIAGEVDFNTTDVGYCFTKSATLYDGDKKADGQELWTGHSGGCKNSASEGGKDPIKAHNCGNLTGSKNELSYQIGSKENIGFVECTIPIINVNSFIQDEYVYYTVEFSEKIKNPVLVNVDEGEIEEVEEIEENKKYNLKVEPDKAEEIVELKIADFAIQSSNGCYSLEVTNSISTKPEINFTEDAKITIDGDYAIVELGVTAEDLAKKIAVTGLGGKKVTIDNITDDGKVKTGTQIKLNDEIKYVVVVKGDIDGDGKIRPIDVTIANKLRIPSYDESELKKKAADMDLNGLIEPIDITNVNDARIK